jgi:hypothetical protein
MSLVCYLYNLYTPKTKHTYSVTNYWPEYAMFGIFKKKAPCIILIEELPIKLKFLPLRILFCKFHL